jgi:predicted PurR-regulated permease PerM
MEKPNAVIYNITMRLALIGLIIAFLIAGRPVLLPLAVAVLFTFLLLPISQKLENWNVPRGVAIVISMIVAAAFFVGIIYFLYSQVQMFVDDWPQLSKQMSAKIDSLYEYIDKNFNFSEYEQKNWLNERLTSAGQSAGQLALGIFTATGSFIATVALLPIFIFFLTYYREKYKHFIHLVFKDNRAEHALAIMKKVTTVSQSYLKGLFLVVIILSVLNSAGFLILGLRHAILFGVFLAILNIIPYIGVLIGSILPIIMALITEDSFTIALGVAGVAIFVQFLENNFITPNVVGSSVSINPFAAILALTTSAMIWGVVGMIIALPFIGMMKVAFDNVEQLKPLGFLIGEEKSFSPDTSYARRIFSLRSKKNKPEAEKK